MDWQQSRRIEIMKYKPFPPILAGALSLALTLTLLHVLHLNPGVPEGPLEVSSLPALGLLSAQARSPLTLFVILSGGLAAVASARKAIAPRREFEQVFGAGWDQEPRSLLRQAHLPAPSKETVTFWTLPGTHHPLFANLWHPPHGVELSGLAVLYFHGGSRGAQESLFGSQALFTHLACQGHLILEVADQRYIEVDWSGRVADVRRATAWMKANAARNKINPARIVLAGADAGADLALLAAYTPNHLTLTPEDAEDEDSTVAAALAYYGPASAHTPRKGLFSPLTHASPGSPPALLLHGDTQLIAGGSLALALKTAGAPVVCAAYPHAGHRLDLLAPALSPAYQSILAEIDRFLAALTTLPD